MIDPNSIVGNQYGNYLYGTESADHVQGLAGDDTLYGEGGNDVLDGGTGADDLYGESGNDLLDGGEDNDYLSGGDGGDTLSGGAGDDDLYGDAGDDILDGGTGNDSLSGGSGSNTYRFQTGFGSDEIYNYYYAGPNDFDVVEFGAGIDAQSVLVARSGRSLKLQVGGDVLEISDYFSSSNGVTNVVDEIRFSDGTVWTAAIIQQMVVTPNELAQTMYGTAGDDVLDGGGGDDTLYGEAGNDTLIGGAGNDYLAGDLGNDVYYFGPDFGSDRIGNYTYYLDFDVVEFAAGIDWHDVSVTRDYTSVILRVGGNELEIDGQFSSSGGSYVYGVDEIRFADGTVWNTAMLQQLSLVPSDYSQDFYGTQGNDVFFGAGGNDYLYGEGGNDTLDGGTGNDRLEGDLGNDSLTGGAGDDLLLDDGGNDVYHFAAGFGIDTVSNEDWLGDGADFDVIEFGAGILAADAHVVRRSDGLVIDFGPQAGGSVTISSYFSSNSTYDLKVDEVRFADGTVWDAAELSRRAALPSDVAQHLYGTEGADTLDGGGSDDQLWGYGGNDILLGGAGNDRIEGDAGNDSIDGGEGNDTLYGEEGDDTVLGGAGNDSVSGYLGNDSLDGGDGNDTLEGYDGNDILSGGAGDDTLYGERGSDVYRYAAGGGSDKVYNYDSFGDGQDYDIIEVGAGLSPADASLRRESNDLIIDFTDHPGDSIRLQWFFEVSSSNNYTYKVDEVRFADGTVWNVADLMRLSQLPTDASQEILGSELADVLDGGGGNDTLYGYAGNDTLTGGAGGDSLYGGDGNDTLNAGEDGEPTGYSNSLDGGNGDDILNGSAHADYMQGGTGNDVLIGGAAYDQISGGDGDDIIVGGTGNDSLYGGHGSDTFHFDRGDGWDNVTTGGSSGDSDTIEFGAGLKTDDVMLVLEDYGFAVQVLGTDDCMYFSQYQWYSEKIGEMRFADGTVWTQTDIEDRQLTSVLGGEVRDVITGSEANEYIRGLEGHDDLRGGGGNDVLEGGSGNDRLEGDSGSDTYLFGAGWGRDVVHNFGDHASGGEADRLRFLDSSSTDMVAIGSGYDLVLTHQSTGDTVTVAGFFTQGVSGDGHVDQVTFNDGMNWTRDDLYLRTQVGTDADQILHGRNVADTIDAGAGDDVVLGNGGDDVLDGGAGNDQLKGGLGADTYRFSLGWGNDQIDDTGMPDGESEPDAIRMGDGILAGDLSASSSMTDLELRHADGSTILLKDFFAGGGRVQHVQFADGTLWDADDLIALQLQGNDADQYLHGSGGDDIADAGNGYDVVYGYAGNDSLTGGEGDDLLDGGAGQDVLDGGDGNDMFLFSRGSGQDRILSADPDGAYWDVVQMGAGISADDIALSRRGRDVVMRVIDSGDRVTLVDFLPEAEDGWPTAIEEIWFADGNIWDAYTVLASLPAPVVGTQADDALTGAATDDFIQGGDGNDVLDGEGGWDVMEGGAGNDRYRVDAAGDEVVELAAGGIDSVEASVAWQLADHVENLWLTGGAVQGTGNSLDNLIVGNSADNVIEGGSGDDDLYGGAAEDHGGNDVLRGGDGNDHLQIDRYGAAAATDGTGQTHSTLEGGSGDDTLIAAVHSGLGGHINMLDGGTGNDVLYGSSGDDLFVFRSGDGQDRLHANGRDGADVLRFGAGIGAAQLAATREGDDLVLALTNSTDRVAIDGWYLGEDHRLTSVAFEGGGGMTAAELEALVDAMAGFAAPTQASAFAAGPSDASTLYALCHVA